MMSCRIVFWAGSWDLRIREIEKGFAIDDISKKPRWWAAELFTEREVGHLQIREIESGFAIDDRSFMPVIHGIIGGK